MIKFEPFTPADFKVFKSWINTEEELYQFAGPLLSYPLTDHQLLAYINSDNQKALKVTLSSNNKYIGHCELNYKNPTPRLSRILIGDKALRGQKIGEQITRKMAKLFFEDLTILKIDLNVFEWNKAAIKCYQNVGFTIIPENTDILIVNSTKWVRLNMILNKNDLK